MKVTKITLTALLASMSLSASATTLDDCLVGYSSVFNGATADYGTESASNYSLSISDSTLTLTGGTLSQLNGSRTEFSVTIVLDLTQVSADTSSFTNLIAGNLSSGGYSLGVGVNSSSEEKTTLSGCWMNSSTRWDSTNNFTTSDLSSYDSIILTVTTGDSGLTLYLYSSDGELIASHTASGLMASNFSVSTITSSYASAISELYVFGSELSSSDVASVTAAIVSSSVPEPATASLSLLGLGALLLRRRRH